jgi:amidohydrolase
VSLNEKWTAAVHDELPFAVELRHRLHADPRVTGDEKDTAQLLADAIGVGDGKVVARTGRILDLDCSSGVGPAIAVRTEMDALPIVEQTGVPWASRSGVMHACGHDVHMAAVAAVSRAARRLDLPVPLFAILQPREEGPDSGARELVRDGDLEGIGFVLAAHVQPQLGPGVVAVTPGTINGATDEFTVVVEGRGGHSGYPHTVDDSILALSSIVVSLQQISARRIDPVIGAACMVNQLRAGNVDNVVPMSATGSGTIRTMRAEDRDTAFAAIRSIAEHTAAAHGCKATVEFRPADPPLVNDASLASAVLPELRRLGHPTDIEFRSFGSDDFAFYCGPARGLMAFIGTGMSTGPLHDATFLPSDSYIATAAEALIAGYCAAVSL